MTPEAKHRQHAGWGQVPSVREKERQVREWRLHSGKVAAGTTGDLYHKQVPKADAAGR